MKKRFLSLLLVLCMVLTLLPALSVQADAAPTVYKQKDSRWANYPYGYKDTAKTKPATIGSSGCGLLAYTNAVYYLNGNFISPKTLADYSVKNGYRINGTGTSFGLYKAFASAHGSEYGFAYVTSVSGYSNLKTNLKKGYVAICSKPGHIMAIVDYNSSNEKYLLLDSYPASSRGTSSTGYAWKTASQLDSIELRSTFYILKSTGKKSLSASTIHSGMDDDADGQWIYLGYARTCNLFDGDTKLKEGTDYTVVYANNLNAGGTATATFTGKGNYTGTHKSTIKMVPRGLTSETTFQLSFSSATYTGSEIKPKVTAVFDHNSDGVDTITLKEGTDYTLSYSNNIDPGTGTVTITGKGNYTGSKSMNFSITADSSWQYFDLNGYGDDTAKGNIADWGTADVYINGRLAANDCTDFYKQYPSGTTYEIKDVQAKAGYNYAGEYSGSLSGTIGSDSKVNVALKFVKETKEVSVSEGTYLLVSALDHTKAIGVADGSTSNKGNLELQTLNRSDAQFFTVQKDGSYYRIKSVLSGLVMDVAGGSREPRTNLQQYGATDSDAQVNQQFRFLDAGNGYVYIKSLRGGFADVAGGKTADATNIQTYFFNATNSQKWKLVPIDTAMALRWYNNYSGKNYFANSDFSGTLDAGMWNSRDTSIATISIDTSVKHNGYNSLKIVNTAAGSDQHDLTFITTTAGRAASYENPAQSTKEMTMSFWAKSTTAGAKLNFRWGHEATYHTVTLSSDWAYYTLSMNRTAEYDHDMHPYVDTAGTVWIAELQLEDGTRATAFVPDSPNLYQVTYQTAGEKASLPAAPTRAGYRFDGWYTARTGGSEITGSTTVPAANLNLYAHWSKAQTPLSITQQPADYSGELGATARFTIKATGDGLQYHWQYSDDNGQTWTASRSTGTTATCVITAARDGRLYRCVVTDAYGVSIPSRAAKITALPATTVVIVAQPKNVSGAVDDSVTFTVKAQGDGLRYQWQYKDVGGSWKNSTSKTATATCKVTAPRDGRLYRCEVTDRYGNTVTSNSAKITVKTAIITQPKDYAGVVGGTAAFTVKATGASLSYQWQYSTDGGKTWLDSKSTGTKATCAITAARDGRLYRCVVTSANGTSAVSGTAKLIVKTELKITAQPKNYIGKAGTTATFTVKATGDGLKYQWQYSDDNGGTWTTSSSTTATATCMVTDARDGRAYRCIITDQYGDTVTSNKARLFAES